MVDVGIDYNYVRTNAAAGDYGCFAMNGGNGWAAFNFTRSLGIVGEIAMQHFFFQADDGIRDATVTGVQTCALPIWRERREQDLPRERGVRVAVRVLERP